MNDPKPKQVSKSYTPHQLGIIENLGQFSLLILVNALVGGMIGLERSLLPSIAEEDFGLHAHSAMLSFIAIFGMSKAITNYFAGRWSDDFGRRPVLCFGWLIAAPIPLILMWATEWYQVLLANLFLGVSQGLTWSTTVIMKIDLAGPKRRGLALGINECAGYLSVGLTAIATSYIAAQFGLRPHPFYLGVAFVLLGAILSLFFVKETRGHAVFESLQREAPPQLEFTQRDLVIRTSFSDRVLSSVCQAGFINNLNDGMAWGLFPLLFLRAGADLKELGILTSLYPIVWGLAQLFMGAWSDRIGRKGLIMWGMWMQAVAIYSITQSDHFSQFALAMIALGLGTAMVYPTLLAAIGDVAHPSWRASAIGIYRLWRDMGYAAGALCAGMIADHFGLTEAVLAISALTALSGLIVALRMKESLKMTS